MLNKNNIIELFDDNSKQIIYSALQNNQVIQYTKNERAVPLRTKSGIENIYTANYNNRNYIMVIDPDRQQLDYFDFTILNIETAINDDMPVIELIEFLKKKNKEKFIKAIESSHFNFLSQYSSETVYNYINSLL